MADIARAFDRAIGIPPGIDVLKALTGLSGAGLIVSLILASYGLDLSAGFF